MKRNLVGHLANITMGDYVRDNYGNSLNHFSGSFSGSCVHLPLAQNQN